MPPRRSTRSVTVEPEPEPSTAVKRKRKQAPADNSPGKENVVVEKPPTRSSVGQSSKGRIESSTRPNVSLKEEVDDSEGSEDGEGDAKDSPPPVKKSRPSPEVEDSEEDPDDD